VAYCHVAVAATIYLALCSFVANDDLLCVRIRSGKKNSARFSRQMLANEVERFKPPQYVAFRTMERWVVIPVIARMESREGGRLYGYWFSRFTPEGTLREVPVDYVVELGNDDDPTPASWFPATSSTLATTPLPYRDPCVLSAR
jgi:hypothetical protein